MCSHSAGLLAHNSCQLLGSYQVTPSASLVPPTTSCWWRVQWGSHCDPSTMSPVLRLCQFTYLVNSVLHKLLVLLVGLNPGRYKASRVTVLGFDAQVYYGAVRSLWGISEPMEWSCCHSFGFFWKIVASDSDLLDLFHVPQPGLKEPLISSRTVLAVAFSVSPSLGKSTREGQKPSLQSWVRSFWLASGSRQTLPPSPTSEWTCPCPGSSSIQGPCALLEIEFLGDRRLSSWRMTGLLQWSLSALILDLFLLGLEWFRWSTF